MSDPTLSRIESRRELAIEIAEANLRRLHTEVTAALEAANIPIETINELAGPNPGPLPAQLKAMLNMGAGYFRTVNATIERLFRARNTLRLRQGRGEKQAFPGKRPPAAAAGVSPSHSETGSCGLRPFAVGMSAT